MEVQYGKYPSLEPQVLRPGFARGFMAARAVEDRATGYSTKIATEIGHLGKKIYGSAGYSSQSKLSNVDYVLKKRPLVQLNEIPQIIMTPINSNMMRVVGKVGDEEVPVQNDLVELDPDFKSIIANNEDAVQAIANDPQLLQRLYTNYLRAKTDAESTRLNIAPGITVQRPNQRPVFNNPQANMNNV